MQDTIFTVFGIQTFDFDFLSVIFKDINYNYETVKYTPTNYLNPSITYDHTQLF